MSTSSRAFPNRVLPSRLICLHKTEVRLCSTERLPRNTQYATLSHCWGLIKQFTLNHENFDTLQESIPVHLLSKTFQDAIFLTQKFGFQYLWIDSLCIVQDDANDWRHESSLMTSVYGGSALNRAASHARDGRVGCFVDRSPMDITQCLVPLNGPGLPGAIMCVPSDFYSRGIVTVIPH